MNMEKFSLILSGFGLGFAVGTLMLAYGLDHLNNLWKKVVDTNLETARRAVADAYNEGRKDMALTVNLTSPASKVWENGEEKHGQETDHDS